MSLITAECSRMFCNAAVESKAGDVSESCCRSACLCQEQESFNLQYKGLDEDLYGPKENS